MQSAQGPSNADLPHLHPSVPLPTLSIKCLPHVATLTIMGCLDVSSFQVLKNNFTISKQTLQKMSITAILDLLMLTRTLS